MGAGIHGNRSPSFKGGGYCLTPTSAARSTSSDNFAHRSRLPGNGTGSIARQRGSIHLSGYIKTSLLSLGCQVTNNPPSPKPRSIGRTSWQGQGPTERGVHQAQECTYNTWMSRMVQKWQSPWPNAIQLHQRQRGKKQGEHFGEGAGRGKENGSSIIPRLRWGQRRVILCS